MIKVLIVVSYLSGGGAEHVARKNLECLLDRPEYQAALLTCDQESAKKYPAESYILQDFKKLHGKLSQGAAVLGYQANYQTAMNCLRQFHPGIIHIHDFIPMTPSVWKAIREYKAKSGCKVILTHHTYSYICTNDSLYDYSADKPCEECIGKLDATIIRKKCSGSLLTSGAKYFQKKRFASYWDGVVDLHISPSVFLKQKLLQANPELSAQVVYNPCIDRVLPVSTRGKVDMIVYFGRISREKNIVSFAKIFARIPTDYRLLVIGSGKLAEEMAQTVSDAPEGKIRFLDRFLPTEELYRAVSPARYFILPSVWYENSPVSIVEAINWSLVPLVSNIGGMEELIHRFRVGRTFDPKDEDGICSMIQNLGGSDEAKQLESARAQLRNFTSTEYSKKMSKIYWDLISPSFPQAAHLQLLRK